MTLNLKVPRRTHQITIQTTVGTTRPSKSFSIYSETYSNDYIFNEITKVLTSKKLNREMLFDVKDCSHIVILTDIKTTKTYSKAFKLHQYSIQELFDVLYKHFIKEGKK